MALQIVDDLLNNLQSDDKHTFRNAYVPSSIDQNEILIQEPSSEEEWSQMQKLCANSFGTMHGSIWYNNRFVAAHKFYNEAYMAVYRGKIVGIIMSAHWGSIRVIGPIACDPSYQRNGIASIMINYILKESPQIINNETITRDVLITFCASFHVPMYIAHGFRPRFVAYYISMKIHSDLFPKKYLTDLSRVGQYTFKQHKQINKQFVAETKVICNSIYKGLDLSLLIEGNWKMRHIGSSFALYDKQNRLNGFAVLNYGKNAEVFSETDLKINCLVASDEEAFTILLFNVLNFAQDMGKTKVTAEINTSRFRAFHVVTEVFDFVYNPKEPMMTMGQCRGSDQEYDDHNMPNSFILDSW